MNKLPTGLIIYWLFACIFMGLVEGHWHVKCPNDKGSTAIEILAAVFALPVVIGYLITSSSAPPAVCTADK